MSGYRDESETLRHRIEELERALDAASGHGELLDAKDAAHREHVRELERQLAQANERAEELDRLLDRERRRSAAARGEADALRARMVGQIGWTQLKKPAIAASVAAFAGIVIGMLASGVSLALALSAWLGLVAWWAVVLVQRSRARPAPEPKRVRVQVPRERPKAQSMPAQAMTGKRKRKHRR